MEKRYVYILLFVAAIGLSSCVTGGFDENPQLDARNEALAKAPNINAVFVNGTKLERNAQSLRIVEAHPGDVLTISADISSGKDAELETLEVTRQYYGNEDPLPLDPNSETGVIDLTGNTYVYDFQYTVPAEDDDGFEFHDGDIILVHMLVGNTSDNFGYRSFEILITH
ncbi:MAG TPA: hypothetical protein VGD40_15880 [Chryseosolibacter sp.]